MKIGVKSVEYEENLVKSVKNESQHQILYKLRFSRSSYQISFLFYIFPIFPRLSFAYF